MGVEQDDIDLMAKLFDYAALSAEQEKTSPVMDLTPQHGVETSDMASNPVLQSDMSASNDSAVMETRQIRSDALAAPEELGWTNEDFDVFPEITNDWSFFGRPWSTHFSEDPT